MSVDMFLKLDGIKGESQDDKHKDEIDILSWSWGMAQPHHGNTGSGQGAGKVQIQDISFTHHVDKATAPLMLHCCNGKHIGKGVLTVRRAGEKPVDTIKIELEDIIVSAVNTGGHGGDILMTESITLNFAKFKLVYTQQEKTGGSGAKPEVSWDMKKNVSS